MKNLFFILLFIFFSMVSCRGNDEEIQEIDQIINLYIKNSAGKDLLNTSLVDTYSNIKFLDMNGERDLVPISSFAIRKNADTINYIDYDAGAVRLLKDSLNPSSKTYRSDFIISLSQTTQNTTDNVDLDTVNIEYSWTPALFQVTKLYYNGKLKFSKKPGEENIITIIK